MNRTQSVDVLGKNKKEGDGSKVIWWIVKRYCGYVCLWWEFVIYAKKDKKLSF